MAELYVKKRPRMLCIADLGCSSAEQNTLCVISELIETIERTRRAELEHGPGQQDQQIYQVHLNDLPENDFNTLFRSVSNFRDELKGNLGIGLGNCFVNGVPGSFYDRLFPDDTLHFVHSSYSLHWLSQLPEGIEDNERNIYIARTSSPNVCKAYYEQFQKDFLRFLECRSKEVIAQGRMVLTVIGRETNEPYKRESSYLWEMLADALNDLVSEGDIEDEKVKTFNFPNYFPSPIELEWLVKKQGCFSLSQVYVSRIDWDNTIVDGHNPSAGAHDPALEFVRCMRSVAEPLFINHFGESVMEKVFQKYANIVRISMAQENTTHYFANVTEDPCTGRYIYMHDLPPKFNQELVQKCKTLSEWFNFCPYVRNGGFGPRLNDSSDEFQGLMTGESWYATNQFMLSVIFHHRMKKYQCLTSSSAIASAIYAPFYPGLEIGRYLWGGFNSSMKDAAALDFISWLREKPEWELMRGKDHFFVAGRITWDFRRLNNPKSSWGSVLLNLPEVKNMTMLTIEASPYHENDFAIPYPTYFHPSTDEEVLKWQELVRGGRRKYLFAFGGAPRPNMKGSIRGELIRQCMKATRNRCKLINCVPNGDMCNSPAHFIKMFMKSDFCLQPPGDSYTRRSTFDSILAGCIPVFFHPGSAYVQYLWHFPKNHDKYSVFIPVDGKTSSLLNVEELLMQIPEKNVSAMREEVIKLIPRIIYAQNKLENIEDAFDFAVNGVLERIRGFRAHTKESKDDNKVTDSSWKNYLTGKWEAHKWDSFF